jgi:hypothetical protein
MQELGERDEWLVEMGGVKIDREIEKEDIVDMYEEFLPLLQAYPGVRLGGYHFEEEGTYSLGISVALEDTEEAMELGEELDQESIFNIGTLDLEFTGGDGNSPLQDAGPDEMGEQLTQLESLSEKARKLLLDEITVKMDITDEMREKAIAYREDREATDTSGVFVTKDGDDAVSFYQIGMMAQKDPDIDVEVADIDEKGYEINGTAYYEVPITEADGGEVQAAVGQSKCGMQKERVYIDHPAEAPDWASVREGARGGFYYEADLNELPARLQSLIEELAPQIELIMPDALDEAAVRMLNDEPEERIAEATEDSCFGY